MDHLLRDIAPVAAEAWSQLEQEAKQRLAPQLTARRIADFDGPDGWEKSAIDLGRTDPVVGPPGTEDNSVLTRRRRVLPLVEVRIPFTVARAELDDAERGAEDLELDDLDRALQQLALLENRTVFHGWQQAGIEGIVPATPHEPFALGSDTEGYPSVVARAVERLRRAGVGGPYALAIGPSGYTRIVEATEDTGYLLANHLSEILGGEVLWTPGLADAVVLSLRGGDFHLHVGQDLSIGYSHHDADTVHLYLEESFTFRSTEPDAAVALTL
ncbi:MAG TPA: family 1 encapsulin nanocompartment shell protein [Pseudonocardia sp.]